MVMSSLYYLSKSMKNHRPVFLFLFPIKMKMLFSFFRYPDLKIKENTKDYQMSKDLVKLWVQFAYDE